MRCVVAPVGSEWSAARSPAERAALDGARELAQRFPAAHLREVPLVRALDLDRYADPSGKTRIWLALEMLQVTGSFKVRGALTSLAAKRALGPVVVAGPSNHALAVAYAARVLGVDATVCVPLSIARHERARLDKYDAHLLFVPSGRPEDVDAYARDVARATRRVFVSPTDDLDFVGGAASLGFELVRALGGVPERVLAPIASGTLATGLAWALADETDGPSARAPSAERCVWGVHGDASAKPSPLDALAGVVVPGQAQVRAAMTHAHRDMGLILEPRAAAALAPVLFGLPPPLRGGDLVVVLTGRNGESHGEGTVLQSAGDGGV